MGSDDVARMWEANAEAWTVLSRAGYDQCRDLFNTPAFLAMLPDISERRGLDIGCGEGHNTRALADRGATMTGVDLASTFVRYAREHEAGEPRGIEYVEADAASIPFEDNSFDFATAFMSLQDIAEQERAILEAHRVVRAGGFFQFSICHPCFQTSKWDWVLDENGKRTALLVGDYFSRPSSRIEEWTFGAAPDELRAQFPKFKVQHFERTLSDWLNLIVKCGFALEEFAEPTPDDATLAAFPKEYDARIIAYFLIVRARARH